MSLCRRCMVIPFTELPSEDGAGWPHYASLADLESSAKTCRLCALILEVANDLKRDFVEERRKNPNDYQLTPGRSRGRSDILGPVLPEAREEMRLRGYVDTSTTKNVRWSVQGNVIRPWLYGNWYSLPQDEIAEDGSQEFQLVGMGVRLAVHGTLEDAEGNTASTVYCRGSQIRVCTDQDDPLAVMIPGRTRQIDSGSDAAFRQIQAWLKTCIDHHMCYSETVFKSHGEPELPSRVLDLGDRLDFSGLHLLESPGKRGKYIALSHCWGLSHLIMTTEANIRDHRHRIPFQSLPKTFQDAVTLTKKLGVRYLWIDSLCIIQDDVADWDREAAKIGNIYADSFLTLSAAASKDSSAGCFPQRKSTVYAPPDCVSVGKGTTRDSTKTVHFAYHMQDGRPTNLYFSKEWMPRSDKNKPLIYKIGVAGSVYDPMGREHLATRCWTMQERVLAKRIIHFGADQMYWECRKQSLSEDGARLMPGAASLDVVLHQEKQTARGRLQPYMSLIEGFTPHTIPAGRWAYGWLHHIENYSRRNLTLKYDKLPALSGIARLMAQQTGDRYLAGLWRNSILEDLHWRVTAREELSVMKAASPVEYQYGKQMCEPSYPESYRAPSWSWASIDAHINFVPLYFTHCVAKLIDGETTPSGSDEYGGVLDGWIKIEAPLYEILDNPEPMLIGKLGHGHYVKAHLPSGISEGSVHFDCQMPVFPCFALFLDVKHCLVLKATGKPNAFTRIGIGRFMRTLEQMHVEGFKEETVTKPLGPMTNEHPKTIVTIE